MALRMASLEKWGLSSLGFHTGSVAISALIRSSVGGMLFSCAGFAWRNRLWRGIQARQWILTRGFAQDHATASSTPCMVNQQINFGNLFARCTAFIKLPAFRGVIRRDNPLLAHRLRLTTFMAERGIIRSGSFFGKSGNRQSGEALDEIDIFLNFDVTNDNLVIGPARKISQHSQPTRHHVQFPHPAP